MGPAKLVYWREKVLQGLFDGIGRFSRQVFHLFENGHGDCHEANPKCEDEDRLGRLGNDVRMGAGQRDHDGAAKGARGKE